MCFSVVVSRIQIATVIITLWLTSLTSTRAGSFSIHEQSVSGLGSAYAGGAVQAEDASTIFFNPAGIALLDRGELQGGAQGILPSARFTNQGSRLVAPGTPFDGVPLSGGNGGDGGVDHVLPNFYLSQPVFRSSQYGDLAAGFGLSVPFGLETDYDPGWVGRYDALRSKLQTFDLQPTIAYRLFDRISIGVGLDIQYASARLSQAIDFGGIGANALAQFFPILEQELLAARVPPAAIPGIISTTQAAYARAGFVPQGHDGVGEVHGDDWAVGFTIGAVLEYLKPGQVSFFQDGRFGFSYRSAISHQITGSAQFSNVPSIVAPGVPFPFPLPGALQAVFFNQGVSANLQLPEIYHFGLYQRFLQNFAIMGDIEWTRWSELQRLDIIFSNPATPVNALVFDYKDSLRYSIGFEWYANRSLTLRTGFAYDETPIRSATLRTPRIPDNNRYLLSAGLQWKPASYLAFDLAYAHLFAHDAQVNFTDAQAHNLTGKFQIGVDIISASATFFWGGPKE